jgi:acyl-CoA reductase-like NAD-dependent aldehyde dehydrogenase
MHPALRDLMIEHRDDLALLLTLEQGKPLTGVETRYLSLGGIE